MNTTVMGVDPSLTGTGVAILGPILNVQVIHTKGHRKDTLAERRARLNFIQLRVSQIARRFEPSLVVVEAPALHSLDGDRLDRDGLWWLLIDELFIGQFPLVVVPPARVKKFWTGHGNATKEDMETTADQMFPAVDHVDDNGADALAMASLGRALMGDPARPLTPEQIALVDSIPFSLEGEAA